MDGVEVLVLHGSPGSGKSTLAREISEILRTSDIAHAVIDLDELSLVFPSPARSFAYDNLAAIWPNYVACGPLKVLIPSVIADAAERERLRVCVPGARFVVCELTAPAEILKHRVTAREPNEHWRRTLRDFVDLYAGRTDLAGIRDFQVDTGHQPVLASAREVVRQLGWGTT